MAADFATGQAARMVIGQRTFTVADQGASQSLIGAAGGLAYANNSLYVADSNRVGSVPINNRVLIYNNISTAFPAPDQEAPQGGRCPVCVGQANVVLGQPDFTTTNAAATQAGMRLPTDVATDGHVLAVADTDNNRVLIWKTIPASNNALPDVVVGQPDFTSSGTSIPPTAKSMRGPQGVWIQNGKLYVADTQDHRVLIYNSIPTSNGASADLVLGQPNFTTFVEPDLTQQKVDAKPNNMLNPASVTSDGVHLYVTDLGQNRVLIWNSIPNQNQQAADLALGQPDMISSIPNNSSALCTSNGKDATTGNPTYPPLCRGTMSFPRYALSDGKWLFIADGGNDRVLIYRQVPTASGAAADLILGQSDDFSTESSAGVDRLATPVSLAWDGTNLFVSDTYNRRIVVYSPGDANVPFAGVRNAASLEVFAVGAVTLGGTIHAGDVVTVTINSTNYTYTVVKTDTFDNVVAGLVTAINGSNKGAGDPSVIATANTAVQGLELTSRAPGTAGNNITLVTTVSSGAQITSTASGANLGGGQDAAQIAPGALITIYGNHLADKAAAAPASGLFVPTELAGTRVYVDGARVPLLYVSPTQINAQMPIAVVDSTSVSVYVRTQHADGTVTTTTPISASIVPQDPGIFAANGGEPRPAVVLHGSPLATGSVSVDGTINAGDVGTITIQSRSYSYTVTSTDTLETVRNALVKAVNQDPKVSAYPAGVFTRVRLQARQPGAAGQGITYGASVSSGAKLLLTPTGTALCCANTGVVTKDNPVIPGETITVFATGLGLLNTPMTGYENGRRYDGPINQPVSSVSSLAGGKTANVLLATPLPGSVGVFEVQLELNSSLPTDPLTQLTIAQDIYVSNTVTFPVKAP
jgi:uncharacterized protein (TIGR03437 family)